MKTQWLLVKSINCFLFFVLMLVSCQTPEDKATPAADELKQEAKAVVHNVEITQMKFSPAELTVHKGDKIVFINHDILTHDVTEELNRTWSSSPLAKDQSWVLEATETVNYFCSIHPVMKGRIIVE